MIYQHSQIWTPEIISDIHVRADGKYRISGFRPLHDLPSFDQLVFLASGLTRIPLEGYKERCETKTVLGCESSQPLVIETPIYVHSTAGLSRNMRVELARGSSLADTALSIEGKLHPEEKKLAPRIISEISTGKTSKISLSLGADAVQVNIDGQVRTEALQETLKEVRNRTENRIPVFISLPAGAIDDDVEEVVRIGVDAVVLRGAPTISDNPRNLSNYCRIPMIAAIPMARKALRRNKALGKVNLIVASGIRNGADAAKALALGADAVRIDESALIALGYYKTPNDLLENGKTNAKNATRREWNPKRGSGIRIAKLINSMTMEIALLARSLGKGDVHSFEYEDLSALTLQASLMSGIKMAGK